MRATLAVPLTGALAIRVDAGYAENGGATLGAIYDTHMRLGYAGFSTLLKASTELGSSASGHLLVGPAVGIKTHCAIETTSEGISVEIDCDEAEQNVQPTDIGAAFGTGIDLAISGGRYPALLRFPAHDGPRISAWRRAAQEQRHRFPAWLRLADRLAIGLGQPE